MKKLTKTKSKNTLVAYACICRSCGCMCGVQLASWVYGWNRAESTESPAYQK